MINLIYLIIRKWTNCTRLDLFKIYYRSEDEKILYFKIIIKIITSRKKIKLKYFIMFFILNKIFNIFNF